MNSLKESLGNLKNSLIIEFLSISESSMAKTYPSRDLCCPLRPKDRVLSFLLMPDQQACCFGRVPEPNEWLVVDMLPQNGAPILMDQLIEIDGQLEVEEKWEDGFFVGIYHVDASGLKKSE